MYYATNDAKAFNFPTEDAAVRFATKMNAKRIPGQPTWIVYARNV
jgi:hypothetical protein